MHGMFESVDQDEGVRGILEGVEGFKERTMGFTHFLLLLFTEAGEDQIDCIRDGLDQFCSTSGHRVNFSKTTSIYLQT